MRGINMTDHAITPYYIYSFSKESSPTSTYQILPDLSDCIADAQEDDLLFDGFIAICAYLSLYDIFPMNTFGLMHIHLDDPVLKDLEKYNTELFLDSSDPVSEYLDAFSNLLRLIKEHVTTSRDIYISLGIENAT